MTTNRLTVLSVDDDEADAELLQRNLEAIDGIDFEFVHSADPAQAQRELANRSIDVTFLDYHLGTRTGLDVLQAMRKAGDLRPLVVLTGSADAYVAAELAREGADDHISKNDLNPDVLRQAIEEARIRYNRRKTMADLGRQRETLSKLILEANIELRQKAQLDPLTKLLNRAAWADAAKLEHKRSIRYGRLYTILMIDVDHFKDFNDTLGHQAGDNCLQQLSQCFLQTSRVCDSVGRYGGEEFVILAPETDGNGAAQFAEQIRLAVWELNIAHPTSPVADTVTVSIGSATTRGSRWEDAHRQADEALYEAKRRGRNTVCTAAANADPTPFRTG